MIGHAHSIPISSCSMAAGADRGVRRFAARLANKSAPTSKAAGGEAGGRCAVRLVSKMSGGGV